MMKKLIKTYGEILSLALLVIGGMTDLSAQIYDDFLGAGHAEGIKVRTSDNEGLTSGLSTVSGAGLDANKIEASFGANQQEITQLAETLDYEGWIDEQMRLPPSLLLPRLWDINDKAKDIFERENPNEDFFGPWAIHFNYTWWDNNFKAPDQLRHRIAYALSQILVISINSNLVDRGEGIASYYDILVNNSFGNYEDILQEITLDPNMAFYLSHLNNPKTNDELGTRPDENYAREIMQLFSIGLYELNEDGSRKVDAQGEWIPTYDNTDIQELAKVFTGLKGGDWSREAIEYGIDPNRPVDFGIDIDGISRELPLQMDEDFHEQGEKVFLGGFVIPDGQSGLEDIRQAVNHIFMHPNVGPFLARRLIQQLIKSNPSPQYISRVARAFDDNGSGVRGDMKAVIKAIILDREARDCEAMQEPSAGKLKEPVLRYTHIMHAIPTDSPLGDYWNNGFDFLNDTKQMSMAAPSVFNFYTPDHQPQGEWASQDLVGPEFKIHDAHTAIGYFNQVTKWAFWRILLWDWAGDSTPNVEFDFNSFLSMASDPETLVNNLSDETRATILRAVESINILWDNAESVRVSVALYLFMISPDYVVLK